MGILNRLARVTRQQLYSRASGLGKEIGIALQDLSAPSFEGWMHLFGDLLEIIRENEQPPVLESRKCCFGFIMLIRFLLITLHSFTFDRGWSK